MYRTTVTAGVAGGAGYPEHDGPGQGWGLSGAVEGEGSVENNGSAKRARRSGAVRYVT